MVSYRSLLFSLVRSPPDASSWPSVDCCTRHSRQSLGAAWTQSPCPISVGLTLTSAQALRKMCSHPQLFSSNTCYFSRAWLVPQTDQPLHCSGTTVGEKIRPAASKTSSASLEEGSQNVHQSKQKPKISEQAASSCWKTYTCFHTLHTSLTLRPAFPASAPHLPPPAWRSSDPGSCLWSWLQCSPYPGTKCLSVSARFPPALFWSFPKTSFLPTSCFPDSFSRLTHPLPHTTDCEQLIQ